jgi:hypothetical protein
LPDVGGEARRIAYQVIGRFQVAAYGIAAVALLAFMMATVARHRRDPTRMDLALAGLLLCGSLLAFSTAMAVIDLLGFPLLERTMSPYNNLGYAPLSVASAFGLVVLFFWLRPAFMSTAGNHGLGIQEARGGG